MRLSETAKGELRFKLHQEFLAIFSFFLGFICIQSSFLIQYFFEFPSLMKLPGNEKDGKVGKVGCHSINGITNFTPFLFPPFLRHLSPSCVILHHLTPNFVTVRHIAPSNATYYRLASCSLIFKTTLFSYSSGK